METLEQLQARIVPYREHARKLVADWPPLSAEQQKKLAVLLSPENEVD